MIERTLYELFAGSADRYPDETALEVSGLVLSYAELSAVAHRLAAWMAERHAGVPARVGLLASRSLVAYAGYLAGLRLGATVVPLNPAFPPARNAAIAEAVELDAVLADDAGAPQLPQLRAPGRSQWHLDTPALLGLDNGSPGPYTGRLADIAYILFTSGSTGRPKGVPIRHENTARYLGRQILRLAAGPGARFSQVFELTFDPSMFDLFVAWGSGAAVVVPQRADLLAPVRHVNDARITHWFSVPSLISLARRMRSLPPGGMPDLRRSLFAGEPLTIDQAKSWSRAAPGSTLENLYGPTELTITCSGYRLPADHAQWPRTSNGTVPIGTLEPGLDGVILGENGDPAEVGELCVRGHQRFHGYLDPRDNAGRFAALGPATSEPGAISYDPAPRPEHYYRTGDRVSRDTAGVMVHLGRLDDQVKIHGYRVELGEIEALLRTHHHVEEAVVLAQSRGEGDVRLVAAFTGSPSAGAELTRLTTERLPLHMRPERIAHLGELPLNDSGKIDRRLLADELFSAHSR